LLTLQRLFVEIGSFDEIVADDILALDEYIQKNDERERFLSCSVTQKEYTFETSLDGIKVIFDNEIIYCYTLEEIETIRCGITSTRITYRHTSEESTRVDTLIAIGNQIKGEIVIKGLTESNFTTLNNCLSLGVGINIAYKMLNELANDGDIYDLIFNDGIKLTIGGDSPMFFMWRQVIVETISGFLHIKSITGIYKCVLSYQNDINTMVISILLSKLYQNNTNSLLFDTLTEAWEIKLDNVSEIEEFQYVTKPYYIKNNSIVINLEDVDAGLESLERVSLYYRDLLNDFGISPDSSDKNNKILKNRNHSTLQKSDTSIKLLSEIKGCFAYFLRICLSILITAFLFGILSSIIYQCSH